jgi:signal transduction histidine kinase
MSNAVGTTSTDSRKTNWLQTINTKLRSWLLRFNTLRSQLLLSFFLLSILPVVAVMLASVVSGLTTGQRQSFDQLESVATLKEAQVKSWVASRHEALNSELNSRTLPLFPFVLPSLGFSQLSDDSSDRLRVIFQESVATQQIFDSLFVLTPDGEVVVSTEPAHEGEAFSSSPYFQENFPGNFVEPIRFDRDAGQVITTFFQHVRQGDDVIAVIGGRADMSSLNHLMAERAGLGETGETYLVDAASTLITDARFAGYAIGNEIHSEAVAAALTAPDSAAAGELTYSSYRNESVFGVYRWLPEVDLALLAERDQSEALAPALVNLGIAALVMVVAVGLALFAGLYATRLITRPLTYLAETANKISSGYLDLTAEIDRDDEIGDLATAFNTMTAQLSILIDDLERTIVELEKTGREKEHLIEELREALVIKDQFLATISHELRTPLNAILGYSGLALMKESSPEKTRHMFERTYANAEQLLALINDVLDLSRINAGRIKILSQPVELPRLVNDWYTDFRQQHPDSPVDFKLEADPALPETIFGDSQRLSQIASNLLTNAFKFTEQGEIRLRVEVVGDNWQIEVSDTGTGIPNEAQRFIFDEFRQVDGTSTREHGGLGLGLSIVKKLTLLMDGQVAVASEVNKGSTFTITLPLKLPEQPESAAEES